MNSSLVRRSWARLALLAAGAWALSASECPVDDPTNPPNGPTQPVPNTMQIVSGDNQSATVGQQLAAPIVVRVIDTQGNDAAGASVGFAVTEGGGSVANATVTSGSDGQASTTWMLGTSAGAQQVRVSVTGVPSVQFAATGEPDIAASVALNDGNNQTAVAGNPVPIAPSVRVRDQFNNPVPDVEVTFVVAGGGGSLADAVQVTDAAGIATVGSWTVAAGQNDLTATVTGTGISGNPVSFSATGVTSLFDIEIRYSPGVEPDSIAPSILQAFSDAATKWSTLIVGDLADVPFSTSPIICAGATVPTINETIDDVIIYVQPDTIDGPFGTLGQAGPCIIRTANSLPILGGMIFDIDDLQRLDQQGQLRGVILHEMGHVLGLGTIWPNLGLLQSPTDTAPAVPQDTHFSGTAAIASFDSLLNLKGTTYPDAKVPVENDNVVFGVGSLNGHWRESVFGTELMTPSLDGGVPNPLGPVTVESMRDVGYLVNLSASDSYGLPSAPRVAGTGFIVEFGNDIWRGPIAVVDEAGAIVGVVKTDLQGQW